MTPAFVALVRALDIASQFFANNLLSGLSGKFRIDLIDGLHDTLFIFHEIEVHLCLHLHRQHLRIIKGESWREGKDTFRTDENRV